MEKRDEGGFRGYTTIRRDMMVKGNYLTFERSIIVPRCSNMAPNMVKTYSRLKLCCYCNPLIFKAGPFLNMLFNIFRRMTFTSGDLQSFRNIQKTF